MNSELLEEGIELKSQKRYDEAIQILTKCDQMDPTVLYHIGDIYLIFKYPNEALQCFNKSLELNPNQPHIIKEIGRVFMLKRDFPKAVNHFLKAFKMDQQQTDIFKLITICYMESQEYDKAFVYANQQLARFPKDPDSYCLRGKYYLNTCKYEQSIDSLNTCLKLRPNNAYALGTKGQALMMLGKMQESHQCLNEAIQLNPNIAELHVDTGLLFEGMNNVYLAMMSYDQALQIQHDNQISFQRLYNLRLHQYQTVAAKQQKTKITHNYSEVVKLIPECSEYYISLFYTLSNFLQGYLSVTDMAKLNYQKQIGYLKNQIDINQQMGLTHPPISQFFLGIECYFGKTNTELQQYIQEWISQKYLVHHNNLRDLNLILSSIVGDVVKHKNTIHQFSKQEELDSDHLNTILQSNENMMYKNYWQIRGLCDGVNMLQRMLVFCTPFLKSWEGNFCSILVNILCYGD